MIDHPMTGIPRPEVTEIPVSREQQEAICPSSRLVPNQGPVAPHQILVMDKPLVRTNWITYWETEVQD